MLKEENNIVYYDVQSWKFFYKNHSAYGLNKQDLKKIREDVFKGMKIGRFYPYEQLRYFSVIDDNECVGELIISTAENDEEITIAIFKEGKKYAEQAIRLFLEKYRNTNMSTVALVKWGDDCVGNDADTPRCNKIDHILTKLGFKLDLVSKKNAKVLYKNSEDRTDMKYYYKGE